MFEFTKEELEELKRCLSWVINCKDTHYTDITYSLETKLQSIIENFCDHDFVPCLTKINIEICSKPKCLAIK